MGALGSVATVGLNLALADQARRREAKNINAQRDEDIEKIEQRDAEEQRQAADRLRRQLAAQRARAGAAGLGNSASSTAILRGLVQESAASDRARRQESSQAIEAINREARTTRRTSLLDLANTTARRTLSQQGGNGRRSLLGS